LTLNKVSRMKLPFIQHAGAGIHFTKKSIRWIELSRVRHKLSIKQSAVQAIENGDTKTALCKLIEKIRPSFPYVTANLDPPDVHQTVIEVPFQDDEDALFEWLAHAPKKLIPDDANLEDFAISHYLFGDPEEVQRCLFVLAGNEAVEARINLLHSAGLHPVILTSGDLEAGYGMMFNQSFITADALLIKSFENRGCLLEYQKGLLADFQIFDETSDAKELVEEAQSMLASRSGFQDGDSGIQMFLSTDQAVSHSWIGGSSAVKIREVCPLSHLTFKNETLSGEQTVACGMAVKQLYPGLDSINLLNSFTAKYALESIEKKDALITTAAAGGVLLLIFMILAVSGWIVENRKQQLDEQVAAMQDKITSVENARQQVSELRSAIVQVRNLVDGRRSIVGHIEAVGRALPAGVWFDDLRLQAESGSGKPIKLTVRGYALRERHISVLLENLERQKEIQEIRLAFSEQVDTNDIFEQENYREKSLIRYEIQIQSSD